MSALSGLGNPATGRIPTSALVLTGYYRAMGFNAGALCVSTGLPGSPFYNGSVVINGVTGTVFIAMGGIIAAYQAGLPLAANGALCTEAGPAVTYSQGVGFTASGRVAIE